MSMNLNTVASLVREDLVTIAGTFRGNVASEYTFKCTRELAGTLAEGDKVLVRCKEKGISFVTVRAIHDEALLDVSAEHDYKWAFQKVDVEVCVALEQMDEAIAEKLKAQQRVSARQQVLGSLGITDAGAFMAGLTDDRN